MPYTPPTIAAIKAQIISDVEGRIGSSVPILMKAFVRVLATALSGVITLIYRFGAWILRQIFPQTADDEWLVFIGGQYGLTRTPAVKSRMTATATGTNGTIIAAGTLWYLGDYAYSQTAAEEIVAGTATVTVECMTSGEAGNLSIADEITLCSPIAGVNAIAAIASIVTTGEDQETTEDLRTRVMERIQRQPQGGAAQDYVAWAREVAGIVKVFAFRTDPGEVTIYPLQAITGVDRIPAPAKITEVLAYVSDTVRRPLCADVLVVAPTELTVNITITGLLPNEVAKKTEIETASETYLYAAYPRQYPDEVGATDVISIAAIWAIIAAAEATASAATMTVGGTPATSYTLAENEITKLGTITWA
jgi:uncharacterized phage protein gp47/JayE